MTSTRPFAHLHCHTHYSLLDGANRIDQLVDKVKSSGMNSVAITDHGNLYGALEFYEACRAASVNPILGLEAYVAPGSRFDKTGATRSKEASFHLTLLAMNRTGFKNLVKLSSTAFLEGFYYKPRIDKQILETHSEGLICLSGCSSSELSHYLLGEDWEAAKRLAAWYQRVFGDRFYLEIQNADISIQQQCGELTVDLAKQMGLPLVATNDAHYLNRTDSNMHDVLLCVNTKVERSQANRMKMDSDQLHVRTPEEMYEAFPDQMDAVARSQEIANRVDIDLDLKTRHFPVFSPPAQKTDSEYLRELCEKGLTWRYGDEITEDHRTRLDFELSIINRMGYASYFLIVWDFVRFATEQGIPASARGSACGALVAYVLGLSHVCPLKYDLLFERFLDPSRTEPPDIDIDFCRDRRQEVIDYTKQKYGEANVCQIGTFGTLKAKAAVRDVSRVLSVPPKEVDVLAKMIPETLNITLAEAIEESTELRESCESNPTYQEIIDLAKQIEGLARSAGTHAAGVVVSDCPITDFIPVQTISGKTDIVTQWEGPTVEKAGLLKMDFLGLRNLTILDKAVKNVRKHRGVEIDPVKLPLDDTATFALLQRGETKGIFQLESGGMRDLLTKMRPDKFNDIIATSALYRPGPLEGGMVMTYVRVKHGEEELPRVHPIMDSILNETYGVMVYQEQVMRILSRLGGIELSQSYQCIKAISKKKLALIEQYQTQFIEGAQKNGLDKDKAAELFELIKKFAGYGFNKSHSTAYGAVAYQTAYLKAHFPVEFMAALLSCEMEDTDRITEHIDDCRRMKIEVLSPDVNRSDVEFSVVGQSIAFGLGAIKGIGEQAMHALVEERRANGPYLNLFDLAERLGTKVLPKSSFDLLIHCGALDSFGGHRAQYLAVVERALQSASSRQRDKSRGQRNLFDDVAEEGKDDAPELPEVAPMGQREQLALEKAALGFYLTSHPLTEVADQIKSFSTHSINTLHELDDGTEVLLGGMISAIKKATTKKPSRNGHTRYVNFDFEDSTGVIRCIMWPEEYSRLEPMVTAEGIRFLRGRIDRRSREPNIVVDKMWLVDDLEKELTTRILIKLRKGLHDDRSIERVRDVIQKHPGKTKVLLAVEVVEPEERTLRRMYVAHQPLKLQVIYSRELKNELQEALGMGHVTPLVDHSSTGRSESIGR